MAEIQRKTLMMHLSCRLISSLVGGILLCTSALGQEGGLRFSLRDLGTFGGSASRANAINNEGQVVGVAYFSNGDSKCFLWRAGFTPLLFTLNSQTTKCEATAISPDGVIAGSMVPPDSAPWSRAFLRSPSGSIRVLEPLKGDEESFATGVFKENTVGNSYSDTNDISRAAKWDSNGTIIDLLGSASSSFATATNSRGQIVGYGPGPQPWVWYQGSITYLPKWTVDASVPWAINDSGFVTGSGYNPYPNLCAAMWSLATPSTPPQNLGCNWFQGVAISNDNWIAAGSRGFAWCNPGCPTLIVSDSHCRATNLQTLLDASGAGWEIVTLTGINDSHQIVGYGYPPGGLYIQHGFLLIPNNLPLC
jgi:probable HAF family extracellular repeat protein